jgi:HJR/Mrr/RecB family endonuclease
MSWRFGIWVVIASVAACGDDSAPPPADASPGALAQQAYLKASNTGSGDFFGYSVALSADGSTLAVGAYGESSAATGIDGDQNSNAAQDSGAVYVFTRSGTTWSQQAYLKASNAGTGDRFGYSIALSRDGSTLAVGADQEASNATGIGGDQLNDLALYAGAAYVFTRSGSAWSQQAYVKASNCSTVDRFGTSIALSGDGSTLTVGAPGESSNAVGVNGDQSNDLATQAGAVYVFTRSGATWSQQAYVKASNTGFTDLFGQSVALAGNGSTLAVGATLEASRATGVDGDQTDNLAEQAGAVYVLTRSGTTWSQQAYLKASNTGMGDGFGQSVALAGDGSTLAVSANREDSRATGIGGDQFDNSVTDAGAVYVFGRSGSAWSQQAYVKASNTGADDAFGAGVVLSEDGSTLAVGAHQESSSATGIDGAQADDSTRQAGAVYLFRRAGTAWSQRAYVKASNSGMFDELGRGVALSADGAYLVAGASSEASAATGIDGNQTDNSAVGAGAVYVFH